MVGEAGEALKVIATVIGLVLSAPALVVLVRVALAFGRLSTAVEQLADAHRASAKTFERFAAEVREAIGDHGERLAVIEDRTGRRAER